MKEIDEEKNKFNPLLNFTTKNAKLLTNMPFKVLDERLLIESDLDHVTILKIAIKTKLSLCQSSPPGLTSSSAKTKQNKVRDRMDRQNDYESTLELGDDVMNSLDQFRI